LPEKDITSEASTIDIEKLRSEMVSKCEEILKNHIDFIEIMPIPKIYDLATPADMTLIQRSLEIHNQFVRRLQMQKPLLLKAKTIEELCAIFSEISNELTRISLQLDEVLREAINNSSHILKKITPRYGFLKKDT